MSIPPSPEFEVPLDDAEGERLIAKADALIHRNESFATPPESDDLPVLTDVVDERIEPYLDAAALRADPFAGVEPTFRAPSGSPAGLPPSAERLVALDTAIGRHIEEWVANELPQIVSRELDELAERLANRAAAHLRATLLPLISAEIAENLDRNPES